MSELPQDFPVAPKGDFVLPFDIAKAGVRGRLVRLDLSSTQALSAHALPEPAKRVAGEALALAVLLGTALKLDGRLSVQTKSDGALNLVMADYYGAGSGSVSADARGIRGFARLDAERFAHGQGLDGHHHRTQAGRPDLSGHCRPVGKRHRRFGGNLFRPVRATAHRAAP